MKRLFQFITACVLLLSAGFAPVFADQNCKPVDGHFEANVVPPGEGHCPSDPAAFCTAGRVWGGIQGNYQFVMTGAIPSAAPAQPREWLHPSRSRCSRTLTKRR